MSEIKEPTVLPHFDAVMRDMEKLIAGDVSAINIFSVCVNAMQCVEQIPGLTGPQKKQLVLAVLTKLVTKLGADAGLLVYLPQFIDIAISIANSEIVITMQKEMVGCCGTFCSELFKRKPTSQK